MSRLSVLPLTCLLAVSTALAQGRYQATGRVVSCVEQLMVAELAVRDLVTARLADKDKKVRKTVKLPKKTRNAMPEFPERDVRRIEAAVAGRLAAGAQEPTDLKVVGGDPDFGESVLKAVARWRFTPLMVDDAGHDVQLYVECKAEDPRAR